MRITRSPPGATDWLSHYSGWVGSMGSFFDGLGRFIASAFGWAGNSFRESKALRDELTKEQRRGQHDEDQEGPPA